MCFFDNGLLLPSSSLGAGSLTPEFILTTIEGLKVTFLSIRLKDLSTALRLRSGQASRGDIPLDFSLS